MIQRLENVTTSYEPFILVVLSSSSRQPLQRRESIFSRRTEQFVPPFMFIYAVSVELHSFVLFHATFSRKYHTDSPLLLQKRRKSIGSIL
ncbi:hypothetical protein PROFUN_05732 [Planoprotostelium fungivorum]|uniref:Uncharacterized protein n=1 Tax=Planoprotostelium fungivorum TaxID=1890364 RepID=A0A2P6NQH8_9EUKA|nr:hypothetical protein PROFUN_05732 [Planoprotostelium fungivorum]